MRPYHASARALAAALALAQALAGARGAVHGQGITLVTDLAYRAGPDADPARNALDLYLPPGQGWPLAVVVHGGDWRGGRRRSRPGERYDNVARALAERGIAVALVGYRVTDGGPDSVRYPTQVEDVAAAAAFARAWLVARGTRAGDLFLVGHEAGAHIAALLAINPRPLADVGLAAADVQGVVAISGAYRVEPLGGADVDVFGSDPAVRIDASPRHQVTSLGRVPSARFLLVVGALESTARRDEARGFLQALAAAGVEAALETPPRDADALVDRLGLPGDDPTEHIAAFILDGRTVPATATPTATPPPTSTPAATATASATPADVAPPLQPPTGPGGVGRPYPSTRRLAGGVGAAAWRALLPDAAAPAAGWPVVVFLPDAGRGVPAAAYEAWLAHLAGGGALVVVPEGGLGPRAAPEGPAAAGVDAALAALAADAATRPDGAWRAWVGHGSGADVAARMAAGWYARHAPPPRALMAIGPRLAGDAAGLAGAGRLPGDAAAVLVTLSDDARDPLAEDLVWRLARGVPGRQRALLALSSDRHGRPPLLADGRAPLADGPGTLDALDWRGTWRWLDALVACLREGRWCGHVLEDAALQADLGAWSDGTPVRAVKVNGAGPRAPWCAVPLATR